MTFTPNRLAISNITQANPAVVTTSVNHNLTTGQVVRVHVPNNFGMVQLNQQQLSITVLSSNTFSLQYTQTPIINVDSTLYTAFTTPSKPGFTAEILPMGSGATPLTVPPPSVINGTAITDIGDAIVNNSTTPIAF